MKPKSILITSQITGLLLLAGGFAARDAQAQDYWTGGGDGINFSNPNNWSSLVAPVSGDALEFGTVGPSATLVNDLTGYGFTSITYDGGGIGFTLTGNAFTNGTGTAGTIINLYSSNDQTINNNLILGNANQTINLSGGNLFLNGILSGAGPASGLILSSSSGSLSLNGANTYGSAGTTTISSGMVKIGNPSAFGASRVNLANGATMDLNGHSLSTAFINNGAALYGGIIDNVSAGGNVTLKVGGGQGGVNAASGTYTSIDLFSGIIQNTTGTVGLTKVAPAVANQTAGIMATASQLNGPAVLRLSNANTYSGPTTINGGILDLYFGVANNGGSAITANIISPNSALVLAGGDLIVYGTTGISPSQTFAGLTLNAGASHLACYRQSSTTYTLTLGGITRNVGSTVDFQSRPSASGSNAHLGGADGIDTTTNVNANFTGGQQTILGGYATYNAYVLQGGGSWAVSGSTANTAKTITGAPTLTTGFTAAKDVDAAIGTSTPAAMTINSLRFNTAGAYTVNTAGNLTNATGGILETLTVGANAVVINNNNLTSGNGQDLIIHQYNTAGGMTIGANLVDNGGAIGLTKSGPGSLTLTPNSANTFSGQLTLNAGTVTLGNANALNGVPPVVFGGMSQTFGGNPPGGFTFANGTLNLNGNSASVASLTASADSSGTALVQNAAATPATLTVNGTTSQSFSGTLQDGTGGGALSLVLSGSGTQTLGGTLSYSGTTTVSAGTLALTTPTTNTAGYAVNGTLNVSALSSNALALTSPQTLSGSGTVAGSVTVASGAHTRPGPTGVTNTITGNLTYSAGAKADFDLNPSATSGPNDQIVLSGAGSVLTCGGVALNINLIGASLDTTTDYVLFKLTGGSASISNSFNSVPTWLGTVPANAGSYSVVTDPVNKNVRLHYSFAAAPTVVGAATPATVVRNQSTFISVTNTPGSGTITNVYLNLSLINGSTYVPLTLSAVANVYTNTIIIPAAAPVGSSHVVAYATDNTSLTGSGNIALTINATSEVWNGGSSVADNWSTNENWVSGLAPGLVGDSVTFDGTTRLTPVMASSFSVTSLTFPSTAGAFVMSTPNSSILTLTGGLTNNSASAQILNLPVAIPTTQTVNTAVGDLTLGGAISGGGLAKAGPGTLYMGSAANAYTGSTVISNGTVSINQNAGIGSGPIMLAGGTLASGYAAATRLTLGNAITVPAGNTGTILMSALNRLNGTVTGGGILNLNAPGGQDDLGGSWSTYAGQINIFGGGTCRLVMNGGSFDGFTAAAVTLTNVSLSVADNSTGNTINVGALTLDSTATITGPYLGANPLFVIGARNQNDWIGGAVQNSTRITKVGSGNLTIASTVDYTGPTWLSAGTLTVLGTISASPLTNYNGVLSGTGTVFSADLEAGSTVAPAGTNYGTLTSSSDWTFNGGTNLVQISTTNRDLIAVGGNLNLVSGAVQLVVGNTLTNGTYKLMSYANSLSGSAGNLTLGGFSQSGQTAVLSGATAGEIDLVVAPAGGANLVWAGAGTPNFNNYWDIVTSLNWSNGPSLSVFTPGDHVTFNDSNPGNTYIDVRSVVQPSSMVVTGAQSYTFVSTTGGGKLSGPTNSLSVKGTGSLEIDLFNDYGGPTTIGAGYTLTAGNGSGAASLGTGNITNNGTLIFNQTNNLSLASLAGTGNLTANGSGTLTLAGTYAYTGVTTIGSGATFQVGTNGPTGPLLGPVTDNGTLTMNVSGTVVLNNSISGAGTLIKNGDSTTTMNVANTYQGNTFINHGVLKLGASDVMPDALSVPGSVGWFILDGNATNAGLFDLNGFNDTVNLLQGLAGTAPGVITNSSAASGTNTLTFGNDFTTAANTYAGLIAENLTGAKIALVKQGGSTNILTGGNSYSGGTIVKGGNLTLGNSGAAGSGSIKLSNGVTLGLIPNGGNSIFPGNDIYTGAGALVTNTSSSLANGFNDLFFSGDANSTNVFTGFCSLSAPAVKQFQSFAGTVVVDATSQLRFASTGLGTNGGDNTTFDIEGTLNTRNGTPGGPGVSLGALIGAGFLSGAGNAAGNGTYLIGAKGIDSTFAGTVQDGGNGNVSIVKVGAGRLTLSGTVSYTGNTTVNDGTLAVVEPVSLDNSPALSLGASTARLDVSGRTDGTLNLGNTKVQTLSGIGTLNGSLAEAANSSVKVGLGTLNVTNVANLNGALVMLLNRTNGINASKFTAFTLNNAAALTVTNVGPALQGGDTFQLFSTGVTGFTATNLPVLTGSLYWTNNLAVNGSLAVINPNPINPNPPPLHLTYSGNLLTLSWPTNAGWTLQMQTNLLNTGLSTNWVDVPGSTNLTTTNIPVSPASPAVFYRLRL